MLRGRVLDVAVDLRLLRPRSNSTSLSELTGAEELRYIGSPPGFRSTWTPGTLEADTEVLYKVTDYYEPTADRSIRWNDPELAIDWPYDPAQAGRFRTKTGAPRHSQSSRQRS